MAKDGGGEEKHEFVAQLQPSSCVRLVEIVRDGSTRAEFQEWLKLPLEHAVAAGEVELTMELLRAGAAGDIMLMVVKSGHQPLAEQLLLGHRAECRGKHLLLASELGHAPMVSLLLKHGADPAEFPTDGFPPLCLAARGGHVDVVATLLSDDRVDPFWGVVEAKGLTALDLAAIGGHTQVIQVITDQQPMAINSKGTLDGFTALHHAAKENQVLAIDALVRCGAALEVDDDEGCSPLHIAARFNSEGALLELLRLGALKERRIHDGTGYGLTPLLLAIKEGQRDAARALMVAGADVTCRGGQGTQSALEFAISSDCTDLMKPLLEYGANASESTSGGYTALHWAAWVGNTSAIDYLVEAGANVEARITPEGTSPLHCAAGQAGNTAAIEALARHGAKINAQLVGDSLRTPLHIAARNCKFELSWATVDALLKAGADETMVDSQGHTPLTRLDFIREAHGLSMDPNVERTRVVLVNAPRDRADRAWRRRALFIMCRAHPDRVRIASVLNDPTTRPAKKHAVPGVVEGGLGWQGKGVSSPPNEIIRGAHDFAGAMGSLIGLQVDGIFRTIIEFL